MLVLHVSVGSLLCCNVALELGANGYRSEEHEQTKHYVHLHAAPEVIGSKHVQSGDD
jgi:hypothetical protein